MTVAKKYRPLHDHTTVAVVVPRIRVMTIDGVKGIWVPLHPLTETRKP